jgi:hypothetical protein
LKQPTFPGKKKIGNSRTFSQKEEGHSRQVTVSLSDNEIQRPKSQNLVTLQRRVQACRHKWRQTEIFFITLELYVRRPVPDRPATESTPEGEDSG